MGKRTHGPQLLHAIEANDHAKVHEILAVQVKNKEKIKEVVTAEIRRLPQGTIDVPLILSASIPDPSIIKYFITKHSVDVNFVYKFGYHGKLTKRTTPLIHSIRRGLYPTVEVLLALNADTAFTDHKGRTALHHAVRRANFRMAKMIVARGGNPNAAEKGQNSPLHVATKLGHVELVRLLTQYGGDLYKRGMFGALPIHIAAKEGHVALVQLFAQREVNVNMKVPCFADEREKTPLHVAAEEGHKEMVLVLVDHFGADVNMPDSEGETALHCTVIREYDQYGMKSKDDYADAAKVLIRCGADVNLRNGRGETPLHLAARNEFHKVIDLLIIAGADPFISDNDSNKPIDLVADEDTVSKQTLKRAMEDRDKFAAKLMEMRGLSASLTSVPAQGMSINNLPGFMNNLGSRTMSTPGLNYSEIDGQQALYAEDGYLMPHGSVAGSVVGSVTGSMSNIPGLIGPSVPGHLRSRQNSVSSLSSFHSMASQQLPMQQHPYPMMDPYGSLDSDSKDSVVSESAAGRRHRKKSADFLLNQSADYSSDSSHYEEHTRHTRPRSSSVSQIPGYMQMNGNLVQEQMALMLQQQHRQQQQQAMLLKQRMTGQSFESGPLRSSSRSLQAYPVSVDNHNLLRNNNRASGRRNSGSSSQRTSASSQKSVVKRSPSGGSDVSSVREGKIKHKGLSSFKDSPTTPSPRSSTSSNYTPTDQIPRTPTDHIDTEDVYENVPDEDVVTDIDVVTKDIRPPPPVPRKREYAPMPRVPQDSTSDVTPKVTPYVTPDQTPKKTAPDSKVPLPVLPQITSQHAARTTLPQAPGAQQFGSSSAAPPPKSTSYLATRTAPQPAKAVINAPSSVTVAHVTSEQSVPVTAELQGIALKLAEQLTPKPVVRSAANKEGSQNTLVNGHGGGMSDSDDTFFDDESFDTVSDYGEEEKRSKPAIAPKPAVRKSRPRQPPPAPPSPTKSPEKPNDPKVQIWLEDQVEYARQRQNDFEKSNGPVSHSSPGTVEKVKHEPDFDGMSDISSVSVKKKTKKKKAKTKKSKSKSPNVENGINGEVQPKPAEKPAPPAKPAGLASPVVAARKPVVNKANKKAVAPHIALEESFDISMDGSMTWDDDAGVATAKQNGSANPHGKVECEYVEMNSPDVVNAAEDLAKQLGNAVLNSSHQMASMFDSNTDTVIRRKKPEPSPSDENRRHSSTKERYVEQPGFGEVSARNLDSYSVGHTGNHEFRVKRSMSDSNVLEAQANENSGEGTYEELPATMKRRVKIGGEESVDPSTLRPPPNHDHRRVVYNAAGKTRVTVVGGNSDGVYVHRIDPGSEAEIKGLMEGDQILKVNGRSVKGMTREEVTLYLMSLFDTVDMVVRYKKDRYLDIIKNGGMGDSFFVRAWFNYKPMQSGEVKIARGDIFSIRDTMPDGRMGSWRVLKVNAKTNEPQNGFIPNEARAEQVALAGMRKEEAMLHKEQRGGFLRRSLRRAKSADRLGRETDALQKSHNLEDLKTYERVEQRPPGFIRPVVLLGLFCDVAVDRLVENSPGIFEKAPVDVEIHGDTNQPVNLQYVQDIVDTRKHSLMIISPKSIEYLQTSYLYPIVIYLSPGSKLIVKTLRSKLAPNFEKKPSFMYDEAVGFEKQYSSLFTAAVTYTLDDSWFTLLLDTIQRIQNQPLWQPVVNKDQSEDSSSVSDASELGHGQNQRPPMMKPLGKKDSNIPDPIATALQRHGNNNNNNDPFKPPSQTSLTYNGFFMDEDPPSPVRERPPVGSFTRVGSTRPPRGRNAFRPNHSADELTLEPLEPPVPRSILKKRTGSDASQEPPFLLGQSGSSPNLAAPPTPTQAVFQRKGSLGSPPYAASPPSPSHSNSSTSSLRNNIPVEDVFMQQVMTQHTQSSLPRQRGRSAVRQTPPALFGRPVNQVSTGPSASPTDTNTTKKDLVSPAIPKGPESSALPQGPETSALHKGPDSPALSIGPESPASSKGSEPSPTFKKDDQWKVVVANMLKTLTSPEQALDTIDELDRKSAPERLQCIQEIIALWNRSRVNPNAVESQI